MSPPSERYNGSFFDFITDSAIRSADAVVPIVKQLLPIESVVDVGCGCGVWTRAWKRAGVQTVVGVDGDYVDRERLVIDEESFVSHDLTAPLDLRRKFDLVQSLEVAEHLEAACADTFIDSLVRHGDIILFSAALPGQGGIHHVNEQPFAYWRDRFVQRGFVLLDPIRTRILSNENVAWWYRYGILVYVRNSRLSSLPDNVRSTAIPTDGGIPDHAPLSLKLRRSLMKRLPSSVSEWLSLKYMQRSSS